VTCHLETVQVFFESIVTVLLVAFLPSLPRLRNRSEFSFNGYMRVANMWYLTRIQPPSEVVFLIYQGQLERL